MLPYNRSKCRGICRDILVRQDAETREFSQHFIEIRDVARKDRFTEIKCHFKDSALRCFTIRQRHIIGMFVKLYQFVVPDVPEYNLKCSFVQRVHPVYSPVEILSSNNDVRLAAKLRLQHIDR